MHFDQPGNYTTGSIHIRGEGVHVHIPAGVNILAGIDRSDYPGPQSAWYLLHFHNCTGCGASGGGAIDGRARLYVTGVRRDRKDVVNFKDPSCFNPWECR